MALSASSGGAMSPIDPILVTITRSINNQIESFAHRHRTEGTVATTLWNLIDNDALEERTFVLWLLKQEKTLMKNHGIEVSARIRGLTSTRIAVCINSDAEPTWIGFVAQDLTQAWDRFQQGKVGGVLGAAAVAAPQVPAVEEGEAEDEPPIQYTRFDFSTGLNSLIARINAGKQNKTIVENVENMQKKIDEQEETIGALRATIDEKVKEIANQQQEHEAEVQEIMISIDEGDEEYRRLQAESKLIEKKLKEANKNLGYAKQRLTKAASKAEAEAEAAAAEEAAAEADVSKEEETVKEAKTAMMDTLLGNLNGMAKFATTEAIRMVMYTVLALLLPCKVVRHAGNIISQATLASLVGISRQSKLFLISLKKVEKLEHDKQTNEGEVNVAMIVEACSHVKRAERSDVTDEKTVALAEACWRSCCETSPDKRDVMTIDDVEYTVYYQYKTTEEIFAEYQKEYGKKYPLGLTIFRSIRPFNVRKGKINTCLCVKCEEARLVIRAMKLNMRVLMRPYIIFLRLKRFLLSVRYLVASNITADLKRALPHDSTPIQRQRLFKFVHAFSHCVNPLTFERLCAFNTLDEIASALLCQGALPSGYLRGKPLCLGACLETQICDVCRDGNTRSKLVYRNSLVELGSNLHADINYGWDPTKLVTFHSYALKDDTKAAKSGDAEKVEKMALCYQHRKSPAEFLEHAESQLLSYAHHLSVVKRQKHAEKELHRTMLPNTLLIVQDFSENMVQTTRKDQIQSQHWISASSTIYVAVASFLCLSTWKDPFVWGSYVAGQAVSYRVSPGDGGGDVYLYGEIADDADQDPSQRATINLIDVYSPTKKLIEVNCEDVRVRTMRTVPIIIVSDDKKHDTHFVREAIVNHLVGENGWLNTQTEFPGLAEQIDEIYFDSDGAPSHFKQKGTLHFCTTISKEIGNRDSCWGFGAPGHGKGPHNGLGGIVKCKLRRLFLANDTHISHSHQVYEAAHLLFASNEARERYRSNPHVDLKVWIVLWLDSRNIQRPVAAQGKKTKRDSIDENGNNE